MDALGINRAYLAFQILVCGIWPALSLSALIRLRRTHLTETGKALWALLIIAVPILGPLAFFIVKPGKANQISNL